MDISNFSNQTIRLGEFPVSIDVTNISGYHSNDGIFCNLFTYKTEKEEHFFQIRKNKEIKNGFILVYFKWEEQLKNLPKNVGDIVFDSRNFYNN